MPIGDLGNLSYPLTGVPHALDPAASRWPGQTKRRPRQRPRGMLEHTTPLADRLERESETPVVLPHALVGVLVLHELCKLAPPGAWWVSYDAMGPRIGACVAGLVPQVNARKPCIAAFGVDVERRDRGECLRFHSPE